jgi:hypothetical protein
VRSSPVPAAPDADPDPGIGFDVAYVTRAVAVFGDDPEGPSSKPVADRVPARKAGFAAGGLEQRPPRQVSGYPRDDGVGSVLGKSATDSSFVHVHVGEATRRRGRPRNVVEAVSPCHTYRSRWKGAGVSGEAPDQKLKNGLALPVSARSLRRGRICAQA